MSTNYIKNQTVISEDKVFDQYDSNYSVAPTTNEFDAVKGFFLRKTNNDKDVADGLTDTIIQVAQAHGISAMSLLDQLKDYGMNEILQSVISLINQTRGNTSILGFNKNRSPNPNVARNVLS